jgi:hypothetical protein
MADETSSNLTPEQIAARIAELEGRLAKGGSISFKVSEKGTRGARRDAAAGSRYGRAAPCNHQSKFPELSPKIWYRMPAYAKDGNVVCFFQSAQKFKARYATLGFSDKANLDEGQMWPTAFALKELAAGEEATIGALVKKAVS